MSKLISLIILLCVSPILAIISVAIFLDDGIPIYFKQKRIGKNNKHF